MPITPAPSHESKPAAAGTTAAPKPKVRSDEEGAYIPPQLPTGARLRTLLYIEDNPANMMLVEQIIAQHSEMRLLTAVNGILGIDLARASKPDVILMDINLPEISGVDALTILHEDPATAQIPIVALSANATSRDIQFGIEVGFFRYLTKPIKVKELMETLNVALEFSERTGGTRTCEVG